MVDVYGGGGGCVWWMWWVCKCVKISTGHLKFWFLLNFNLLTYWPITGPDYNHLNAPPIREMAKSSGWPFRGSNRPFRNLPNRPLEGDIFADAGPSPFGSRKIIRYIEDSVIMVHRSLRVRNDNCRCIVR